MADDPLLESTQLRRRLDTEFVCEHGASRAVPVERLGVTSGAVERDHQLGPAALAERLPCDQRLALADHLEVPAACQFGVDDVFFDGLSERLPAPHVTVGKAFPRYVGHRRAAPQRERRPQHRGGRFGVPARQLGATARNELFEVVHVEFARCHRQCIGPAPTDDGEPDGQQLARLRSMHVQRMLGGPRRVVAPHCLDQGVVLDPLSSSDGKRGEQGSRALAFQSKDAGSVEQVDRTEQSDHHRAGRAAADRCRLRDA